jgi:hypothetical protein
MRLGGATAGSAAKLAAVQMAAAWSAASPAQAAATAAAMVIVVVRHHPLARRSNSLASCQGAMPAWAAALIAGAQAGVMTLCSVAGLEGAAVRAVACVAGVAW